MNDTECLHTSTSIIDSRWVITLDGWLGVKRRRKCRTCDAQLETIEIPCLEYFKDKEEVALKTFWIKPKG
jgi:transcriptional regulator NrdR family protein